MEEQDVVKELRKNDEIRSCTCCMLAPRKKIAKCPSNFFGFVAVVWEVMGWIDKVDNIMVYWNFPLEWDLIKDVYCFTVEQGISGW